MKAAGSKVQAKRSQPTPKAQMQKRGSATRPFPRQGTQTAVSPSVVVGGIMSNVSRAMASEPAEIVQAKLTIGAPGDKYEQEADRVAKEVVQRLQAPASPPVAPQSGEEGEDPKVRRQVAIPIMQRVTSAPARTGVMEADAGFEKELQRTRSGGSPLDAAFRAKVEPLMGADFSGVRVHTDGKSDQLARSIQAKAFTTGRDEYFRTGAYEPGRRGGHEVLSHDTTHVEQHGNKPNKKEGKAENNTTLQRHIEHNNNEYHFTEYYDLNGNPYLETRDANDHITYAQVQVQQNGIALDAIPLMEQMRTEYNAANRESIVNNIRSNRSMLITIPYTHPTMPDNQQPPRRVNATVRGFKSYNFGNQSPPEIGIWNTDIDPTLKGLTYSDFRARIDDIWREIKHMGLNTRTEITAARMDALFEAERVVISNMWVIVELAEYAYRGGSSEGARIVTNQLMIDEVTQRHELLDRVATYNEEVTELNTMEEQYKDRNIKFVAYKNLREYKNQNAACTAAIKEIQRSIVKRLNVLTTGRKYIGEGGGEEMRRLRDLEPDELQELLITERNKYATY